MSFLFGPGGYLDEKSTSKDILKYRLNEISFIKEGFQKNIDFLSEDQIQKLNNAFKEINNLLYEII